MRLMIFNIDTHGGVPIYRQVMNQIRRQIVTGQMPAGEQLESVKNLSTRLKVNPMTISKAYGFLVEEGLVARKRGIGLFVNQVKPGSRKRVQEKMLREALVKAASLAIQMGVPAKEAAREFAEHFDRLRATGKGRNRDEK